MRILQAINIKFMNLDLSGKTALVCGSTQGLGFSSASELALLGANIVLLARNETKLKDAVKKLHSSNGQTHSYLVADFSDSSNVQKAIDGYIGSGNIAHILVNNTGGPAGGAVTEALPDQFKAAFESHLICNHILATALLPGMKSEGYGRIINIISTSVKQPLKGLGVSNTVRAAVANWSKTLANEVGKYGITVNNVLPGLTKTVRAEYIIQNKVSTTGNSEELIIEEMLAEIPAGRMGMPEEFGAVVAFLSSPAAAYISGINLPVDGGRLGCL
jgi:3-oxoacyl-[acyl-carrier protein] reductase